MTADEFGQGIRGIYSEGQAIVSTDQHPAVFAKKASDSTYVYLELNDSGQLKVTGGTQYAIGDTQGGTDIGVVTLVVRDDALTTLPDPDGDYTLLRVDSKGQLWVTATDLDIRNLDYATDNVAIKGATGNQLVVNSDGSINVSVSGASNSAYHPNSVNLVKDTVATVVTRSPAATESYMAVMVSGSGLCEWALQFGTTGSEADILHFWTTPAHPTEYVDLPDALNVSSTQTIRVRGTNREKSASPNSDFTGYASLIRKA